MKKMIFLLAVLMLISPAAVFPAAAEGNVTISIPTVEAQPGTNIDVPITFSGNADVSALILTLEYDRDKLVLNRYENGTLFSDVTAGVNFVWVDPQGVNGDGILLTLNFQVLEGASGDCPIRIARWECNDIREQDVAVNAQNGCVRVKDIVSQITSAQLALGTDITVNYYATLAANQTDAQMRFTVNDKTVLVDGTLDGEEYVFPFTGISPQCMGDNIKAELVLGDTVLDTVEEYSVRRNCLNLLAKSADELGISAAKYSAMKTLIADLLEYGAQAQRYKNYKVGSLVNDGINGQTVFTELTSADYEKELEDGTAREGTGFVSAGVYFDYNNKMYFRFTAPDITESNFYIQITDGADNTAKYYLSDFELIDEETGTYILYTDAIYATMFEDWYEIKLCDSSNSKKVRTVQTLLYSVSSYVYAMQNSANSQMADLAKATYNYGASAVAFANVK